MGHWESIAVIASCAVAVLAFIDNWFRRRQQDHSAEAGAAQRVEVRLARLETDQFGTNHGGMREQLNKVSARVEVLDSKVDVLTANLAEMRGEMRGGRLIREV